MCKLQLIMDYEYIALKPLADCPENVPCALRMKTPNNVERNPTHIIFLIDVSESMLEGRKLENVKRCCQIVLSVLSENDKMSLITFGENATLHLNKLDASDTNKASIHSTIDALHCDGCTNLSAGLGYVRQASEGCELKTGLLLLTDGHANRGVSSPEQLRPMCASLRRQNPNLSLCCVAYGVDHNEELMRGMAEDAQGTYNVVKSIEDTAFAFGDTLGGLMSCAYQNVVIQAPLNSIMYGMNKTATKESHIEITVGDVYAGTSPLVLLDIPKDKLEELSITGQTLPDFDSWTSKKEMTVLEGRDKEIELTKLRLRCTTLLKNLNNWMTLFPSVSQGLKDEIEKFAVDVADSFLDGSPLTNSLRSEVQVLRDMYKTNEEGRRTHEFGVTTSQHISYYGLARGFSTPAARSRAPRIPRAPHVTFGEAHSQPADDPEEEDVQEPQAAFQNEVQRNMASLMATASQAQ